MYMSHPSVRMTRSLSLQASVWSAQVTSANSDQELTRNLSEESMNSKDNRSEQGWGVRGCVGLSRMSSEGNSVSSSPGSKRQAPSSRGTEGEAKASVLPLNSPSFSRFKI